MTSEDGLDLTEIVSIAPGGMIGGGIFAVLGVVSAIAGSAAWAAFVAGAELLYSERNVIEEEIPRIDEIERELP